MLKKPTAVKKLENLASEHMKALLAEVPFVSLRKLESEVPLPPRGEADLLLTVDSC